MPIKYYRLRKNLPTFKAGETFYLSDMGNLSRESDNVPAYSWSTLEKFPNILPDWFEEIKEPTRWKPEADQKYYFSDNDGSVGYNRWDGDHIDRNRFEIGNIFKTKEEAERVAEHLKALAAVRGDATSKFVRGKKNWYVCYNTKDDSLHTDCWFCHIRSGIFGLPCFATKEDAQRSIELHRNEWLTIFGIKEEGCD